MDNRGRPTPRRTSTDASHRTRDRVMVSREIPAENSPVSHMNRSSVNDAKAQRNARTWQGDRNQRSTAADGAAQRGERSRRGDGDRQSAARGYDADRAARSWQNDREQQRRSAQNDTRPRSSRRDDDAVRPSRSSQERRSSYAQSERNGQREARGSYAQPGQRARRDAYEQSSQRPQRAQRDRYDVRDRRERGDRRMQVDARERIDQRDSRSRSNQYDQRNRRDRSGRYDQSRPSRQQPAYATTYGLYTDRPSRVPLIAVITVGALIIVGIVVFFAVRGCAGQQEARSADAPAAAVEPAVQRVSFVAVGDNLPNDNIGAYADSLAGETGDGKYDYTSIFAPIKSIVQGADLAYIDQETVIGGNEIGAKGWPSFNTTDEMADAVVDTGFDLVATATNHSYDWGPFGSLEHSSAIWDAKPVAWTGTAATAEQRDRLATMERNGITFALLNYTYGVNAYEQADLPEYAVNFIDRDRIASDVARARKQADVVMIAMHWGTEYSTDTNEEQESLAQFIADLDVDVVLGSHPHVIEPMRWVKNSSESSDHRTLVAFSLGNFICDFDEPSGIHLLEGMLSCDFVRDSASSSDSGSSGTSSSSSSDGASAAASSASASGASASTASSSRGAVRIENVKWTPIICHYTSDRSDYAVYTADDYTNDLAKKNPVFANEDDPAGWIRSTTESIVGSEWF